MKADNPPPAIVEKMSKGIYPVSSYDAEIVMEDPVGTQYDLVPRTKRSSRALRAYWLVLKRVCSATDKWPSPHILHHSLKWACGYRFEYYDIISKTMKTEVDSIAFSSMSHKAFTLYTQRAYEVLTNALGFDVTQLIERPN